MTSSPADLRPCAPGDLQPVVDLLNACDIAATGEPDTTPEDMAEMWSESGFSLDEDAWVVEGSAGALVGYADVRTAGRGDEEIALYVHPDLGEGGAEVAAALLDRALQRAAQRGPVATAWAASDGITRAAFDAAGFEPQRLFFRMRADISPKDTTPATAAPSGIRLAEFRSGVDDEAVHAALVEAFADHVRGIPAELGAFAERHFRHPDFDPTLWTVAWDGDEVAGAIVVFDHGDLAFVRDLGVRSRWRGRGLGLALLDRTFTLLAGRGQTRVDLGVDADDPVGAVRLYERAGFRVLQRLDLLQRPPAG